MKIIKKIIRLILTFNLTILISLLILSLTIKDALINEILYEGFKSTITSKNYSDGNVQTLDDIITEDGVITDNEFVNEILESPEIKDLVNRYLDKMINILADDNISVDELNEFDLEQDMINYIKENKEVLSEKTGIEITDEMIEKASKKIDERDTKKVVKQTIENTRRNLTPKEKNLIKLYLFLISLKLKIYVIIGIIINLVLIAILKSSLYKWLKNLSESMVLSGIGTIIIKLSLEHFLYNIIRTNKTIKLTNINILSITVLISGIVIYIIYKIIDNRIGKEKNNEVS